MVKRLRSVLQPKRTFGKIMFTFPNIKATAESTHSGSEQVRDTEVFDHISELWFLSGLRD